ncbi:hypothetical protein NW755_002555 [Fusarium falciforme]|uniref:Uncharacterized protein n=1 Tax=Fusarium falciforme TaxID=195108 RepID=A0A9W8RGT1_9HYPO|nr:hypothetical protein NW755_002555 [Fusarium falciforme]KAJ4244494.1 hypothetical protein NW757_010540 [Fusarium falciforme]
MGAESHVEIWAMALDAGEVVLGKVSHRDELCGAVQTWVNSSVSTKRNTPSGGETAGQSQQHGALQEVDLAHTLYPEPQQQGLPPS